MTFSTLFFAPATVASPDSRVPPTTSNCSTCEGYVECAA
jgi:hypothetical protein